MQNMVSIVNSCRRWSSDDPAKSEMLVPEPPADPVPVPWCERVPGYRASLSGYLNETNRRLPTFHLVARLLVRSRPFPGSGSSSPRRERKVLACVRLRVGKERWVGFRRFLPVAWDASAVSGTGARSDPRHSSTPAPAAFNASGCGASRPPRQLLACRSGPILPTPPIWPITAHRHHCSQPPVEMMQSPDLGPSGAYVVLFSKPLHQPGECQQRNVCLGEGVGRSGCGPPCSCSPGAGARFLSSEVLISTPCSV